MCVPRSHAANKVHTFICVYVLLAGGIFVAIHTVRMQLIAKAIIRVCVLLHCAVQALVGMCMLGQVAVLASAVAVRMLLGKATGSGDHRAVACSAVIAIPLSVNIDISPEAIAVNISVPGRGGEAAKCAGSGNRCTHIGVTGGAVDVWCQGTASGAVRMLLHPAFCCAIAIFTVDMLL